MGHDVSSSVKNEVVCIIICNITSLVISYQFRTAKIQQFWSVMPPPTSMFFYYLWPNCVLIMRILCKMRRDDFVFIKYTFAQGGKIPRADATKILTYTRPVGLESWSFTALSSSTMGRPFRPRNSFPMAPCILYIIIYNQSWKVRVTG